jgi:hypothetical protein
MVTLILILNIYAYMEYVLGVSLRQDRSSIICFIYSHELGITIDTSAVEDVPPSSSPHHGSQTKFVIVKIVA